MKNIKIQISDDSVAPSVISELDRKIPESTRISPEFQILYPQITDCIDDFTARAKKLANAGTTIHIQKEFTLPDASIFIALDYPMRNGLLEKFAGIFRRG